MLKKNIAIASLLLVSACNTVTEPIEVTENTLESRVDGNTTQLVLVKADGEVILDQGIANLVGNEGAADIKNFSDIQLTSDAHYAFVSVTGFEGRQKDLYDLEQGELVNSFPLASQSGFAPNESIAFACASASAYGTYYVQTLDLTDKKIMDLIPEEELSPEKTYDLECSIDEDTLNFSLSTDGKKEEHEYNYQEKSLDQA